ncbi:MAG: SoxY-related AACIE arm protein [Proteobacteria bacterium]|jgi:sulfur-oxidizing protein SoxY|nr:SoxY-related AACIE arm protein [Ramlibacter sp.]MCA0215095.1 SoxY-related AACIE arm protein [Pseudomonadota bacterium]
MTATRRQALSAGAALAGLVLVRPALAQGTDPGGELAAAVRQFTGGAPVQNGRIKLDIAQLVDNGNTVPMTVSVDSPMTAADHVVALAVFNERNPQREVIKATLGPRAGKAQVATRIRLATSQKLMAVARMSDGSYWQHTADVVVTLAACIEGDVVQ